MLWRVPAVLRGILEDESDWRDVLRVVPIDLDDRNVTANQLERERPTLSFDAGQRG
jgi:hypothetical protein